MHWKRCEYLCLEPTVIREVHIDVEKSIIFQTPEIYITKY